MQREKFSSRLGFLLISAGCAIGLGNVWRFPYITGMYGGAAFVLIYLFFLLIFGLPILAMEFAVGRASQKSIARSFDVLEPKGTKWHWYKYIGIGGNYLLMMFYTTIGGWMLLYFVKMLAGEFEGLDTKGVGAVFSSMQADPVQMTIGMVIVVLVSFGVCSMGLQKGVEKITKVMMVCLLIIMVFLAMRSVTLPGAAEGLSFYLLPDFGNLVENGLGNAIFAAMGQAFFTLSLGIGAIAIFGSYIGKERSLMGEAVSRSAGPVTGSRTALPHGRGRERRRARYACRPDGGPHYFPGVLGVRRGGQRGPEAHFCDAAPCLQLDAGRAHLRRAVLCVHVVCRPFDDHRRV